MYHLFDHIKFSTFNNTVGKNIIEQKDFSNLRFGELFKVKTLKKGNIAFAKLDYYDLFQTCFIVGDATINGDKYKKIKFLDDIMTDEDTINKAKEFSNSISNKEEDIYYIKNNNELIKTPNEILSNMIKDVYDRLSESEEKLPISSAIHQIIDVDIPEVLRTIGYLNSNIAKNDYKTLSNQADSEQYKSSDGKNLTKKYISFANIDALNLNGKEESKEKSRSQIDAEFFADTFTIEEENEGDKTLEYFNQEIANELGKLVPKKFFKNTGKKGETFTNNTVLHGGINNSYMNNIRVVSHEVGHALLDLLSINGKSILNSLEDYIPKSYKKNKNAVEYLKYAIELYGTRPVEMHGNMMGLGSLSSYNAYDYLPCKTEDYRMREGFAEMFSLYICGELNNRVYGDIVNEFMENIFNKSDMYGKNKLPKLGLDIKNTKSFYSKKIKDIRKRIKNWKDFNTGAIVANVVSRFKTNNPDIDTFVFNTLSDFETDYIDQSAVIKKVRKFLKGSLKNTNDDNLCYEMAGLARGYYGESNIQAKEIASIWKNAYDDLKDIEVNPNTLEKNIKDYVKRKYDIKLKAVNEILNRIKNNDIDYLKVNLDELIHKIYVARLNRQEYEDLVDQMYANYYFHNDNDFDNILNIDIGEVNPEIINRYIADRKYSYIDYLKTLLKNTITSTESIKGIEYTLKEKLNLLSENALPNEKLYKAFHDVLDINTPEINSNLKDFLFNSIISLNKLYNIDKQTEKQIDSILKKLTGSLKEIPFSDINIDIYDSNNKLKRKFKRYLFYNQSKSKQINMLNDYIKQLNDNKEIYYKKECNNLKNIGSNDLDNNIERYMISKRKHAAYYSKPEYGSYYGADRVEKIIEYKDKIEQYEATYGQRIKDMSNELYKKWNAFVLKFDNDFLSPSMRTELKNELIYDEDGNVIDSLSCYVPMQNVSSQYLGDDIKIYKHNYKRQLKGSDKIENPTMVSWRENIQSRIYDDVKIYMENEMRKEFFKMIDESEPENSSLFAIQVDDDYKGDEGLIVSVNDNGVDRRYIVKDDTLREALDSTLINVTAPNAAVKFFSWLANANRTSVIFRPTFIIANTIRDICSTMIASNGNFNPFLSIYKTALLAINSNKIDELYKEYAEVGASMKASNLLRINEAYIGNQKINKNNAKKFKNNIFEWIENLMSAFEEGSRVYNYEVSKNKYLDKGLDERNAKIKAGYHSRMMLDWSMRGRVGWLNDLYSMTSFLRANVNSFVYIARRIGTKDDDELKKEFIKKLIISQCSIVMAGIIEAFYWGDDDDYKALSEFDKSNYLYLGKFGNGQFFRIPLPFEFGSLAYPAKQIVLDTAFKYPVDYERTMLRTLTNMAFNYELPNGLRLIANILSNKDDFTDRQIVPEYMETKKYPLRFRKRENTSNISSAIAKRLFVVSPAQLDYGITKMLGSLGMASLSTIDALSTFVYNKATKNNIPYVSEPIEQWKKVLFGNFVSNDNAYSDLYTLYENKQKENFDKTIEIQNEIDERFRIVNNINKSIDYNYISKLSIAKNHKESGLTDEEFNKLRKDLTKVNIKTNLLNTYDVKKEIRNYYIAKKEKDLSKMAKHKNKILEYSLKNLVIAGDLTEEQANKIKEKKLYKERLWNYIKGNKQGE